jgi:hypothetical protein
MRRQESFPWIIVMGGAVLYWTIALGIGIPSLYRLLGEPGPARRVTASETRCVQSQTIDGTPVVFGDCITVRFLPDTAEVLGGEGVQHRRGHAGNDLHAGPDHEIGRPLWDPSGKTDRSDRHPVNELDPSDTAGRTSY